MPSIPLGAIIFLATYVLIAARRMSWLGMDRPAAALLGAVSCVASGVLTPDEANAAVDGSTLLLLFAVMGTGAFLSQDGFLDRLPQALARTNWTRARLLGVVVWGAGGLSALVTNDAVCILAAPVLVRLICLHRLPPLPFLLALATGANTGSVATLVGNPQNMLCAELGQLSYATYLVRAAPLALLCLALNHWLIWLSFRGQLSSHSVGVSAPTTTHGPIVDRSTATTFGVIGLTAIAYTFGGDLAWVATSAFAALMLLHRRDTRQLWPRIDWSLLLFFAGLFVVVEGFVQSGVPAEFFERYPLLGTAPPAQWSERLRLAAIFLVGSNVVSNVPFILVVRSQIEPLSDPQATWELLAVASTFAGNLTLLGSVANIIVAEAAREIGGIGFFDYLKLGLPLALLSTFMAVVWFGWF